MVGLLNVYAYLGLPDKTNFFSHILVGNLFLRYGKSNMISHPFIYDEKEKIYICLIKFSKKKKPTQTH